MIVTVMVQDRWSRTIPSGCRSTRGCSYDLVLYEELVLSRIPNLVIANEQDGATIGTRLRGKKGTMPGVV
jgi:hypothetical protein